jgi:hypothetical protein
MPDFIKQMLVAALAAMSKPDSVLMGLIRHGITIFGGLVVQQGLADQSTATSIEGALLVLVGGGWSIIAKYAVTHWLQVAVLVPAPATADPLAQRAQLNAVVAVLPTGSATKAEVVAAVAEVKAGGKP